jgi:hypothetical protein
MIFCILDPEFFPVTNETLSTLNDHIDEIKKSINTKLLVSKDFIDLTKNNFTHDRNFVGIANHFFQSLNQAHPKKLEFVFPDPQDDIDVNNLDSFIGNYKDRDLYLMLISEIINCAIRTRREHFEELCIASWEKGHIISYHDQNKKWFKWRSIWKFITVNQEQIIVVFTKRNWQHRWTTRYSDELPSQSDENVGQYPFIPPQNWELLDDIDTRSVRNGMVGWIDSNNDIWTLPDPTLKCGQNHWDVQLSNGTHRNVNKYKSGVANPGHINH